MNYKKFLLLGLTAVMTMNAFGANIHVDKSIEQLAQKVHSIQENKAFPNVDVNYIIKSSDVAQKSNVAHAKLNVGFENCTVNIEVTPDFKVGFLGSNNQREFFKEVTQDSNATQEDLRVAFITYHEASHCKMYEIKEPFKADNPQVQKALNDFYQFSGKSFTNSDKGDDGLYYILQENFADAFGFIQLIKNHGATADSLTLMQKIQVERTEIAHTHNNERIIAHNTDNTLKEILKEENIKKIIATDDMTQLQEIALQIANKGMWTSVRTHAQIDQVINYQSLESGSLGFLIDLMDKDMGIHKDLKKNINLHLTDNVLYQSALETKLELEKKFDLSKIKTTKQFESFYQENSEAINTILSTKLTDKIEKSTTNGFNPLDDIHAYGEGIHPVQKQTLADIKLNGAKDVKNMEEFGMTISKGSFLNKIASIRQVSHNDNTHSQKLGL